MEKFRKNVFVNKEAELASTKRIEEAIKDLSFWAKIAVRAIFIDYDPNAIESIADDCCVSDEEKDKMLKIITAELAIRLKDTQKPDYSQNELQRKHNQAVCDFHENKL